MAVNILEMIKKMKKKTNNRNQVIIFSFVALISIVIGISDIKSTMSFINKAESVEGEILEMVRQQSGNS
jgi:hypothetical protein